MDVGVDDGASSIRGGADEATDDGIFSRTVLGIRTLIPDMFSIRPGAFFVGLRMRIRSSIRGTGIDSPSVLAAS